MATIESRGNAALLTLDQYEKIQHEYLGSLTPAVAVAYAGRTIPLWDTYSSLKRRAPRYQLWGPAEVRSLEAEVYNGKILVLSTFENTPSTRMIVEFSLETGDIISSYNNGYYSGGANPAYAGWDAFVAQWSPVFGSLAGKIDLTGQSGADVGADAALVSAPAVYGAGSVDPITGIRKGSGVVRIDAASFGLDTATVKITKSKKGLSKLLSSEADFIYDRSTGYLVFNENEGERGFGDGGVAAIFWGKPPLGTSAFVVV